MTILLSWKNSNTKDATVKIYRSETAIDTAALPEALATLPGDAKSYADETADVGKKYNYVVEASIGDDKVFAKAPTVTNIRMRGPGSNILLQGDYECGYFGEVDDIVLPALTDAYKISSSATTIIGAIPRKYHKFAWKNRILFVAEMPIYLNHANPVNRPDQLKYLRSGLKFNFTSAELEAQVPNIQTASGYSYHCRVPRSTPENWDGVMDATSPELTTNPDTEFNQILGSLMNVSPPVKRKLKGLRTSRPKDIYPLIIADPLNASGVPNTGVSLRRHGNSGSSNQTVFTGAREMGYNLKFDGSTGSFFECSAASAVNTPGSVWPVYELIEK